MLLKIVYALLYAVLVGLIGSIVVSLFIYIWSMDKNKPKIKYSLFYHMYMIAPENWSLYSEDGPCYVRFNYDNRICYGGERGTKFRLSFPGYIRYGIFRYIAKREVDKKETAAKMERCIKSFQRDIENYKEKINITLNERS